MRFVVRGVEVDLTREDVMRALTGVQPAPVLKYGVRVGDAVFPVKQVYQLITGLPRGQFSSAVARRHLKSLGFEIVGPEPAGAQPAPSGTASSAAGWPWEGEVQSLFAAYLHDHGWRLVSMADTASREHGVDVIARKDDRLLGAEVKGWPSKGYADLRRSAETKKTRPATQAAHWFAQALLKAVMLLDSHPGHESLVVLPDVPRYRDLAERTRTGRSAAGVHVLFVVETGSVDSQDWTP
jgi:Holliday junction resolvase-like predicted endonuclease